MYAFLCRWMPEKLAEVAIAAWYLTILILIIAFAGKPMAEFRYMNI